MKLMILTNNPSRASFRLRIDTHRDYLRHEGIETTVSAMPRTFAARRRLFASSRHFDAVLIHRKCLNFWDAQVLATYRPRLIFDFDDAVMHSVSRPQSDYTSH